MAGITEPAEIKLVSVFEGFPASEKRPVLPWGKALKRESLALGEVQQPLRRPQLRALSTHLYAPPRRGARPGTAGYRPARSLPSNRTRPGKGAPRASCHGSAARRPLTAHSALCRVVPAGRREPGRGPGSTGGQPGIGGT